MTTQAWFNSWDKKFLIIEAQDEQSLPLYLVCLLDGNGIEVKYTTSTHKEAKELQKQMMQEK